MPWSITVDKTILHEQKKKKKKIQMSASSAQMPLEGDKGLRKP